MTSKGTIDLQTCSLLDCTSGGKKTTNKGQSAQPCGVPTSLSVVNPSVWIPDSWNILMERAISKSTASRSFKCYDFGSLILIFPMARPHPVLLS